MKLKLLNLIIRMFYKDYTIIYNASIHGYISYDSNAGNGYYVHKNHFYLDAKDRNSEPLSN